MIRKNITEWLLDGKPIGLPHEMLAVMVARNGGPVITYEGISEPPREEANAPSRDINPASKEGRLRALGWRLAPVPRFSAMFQGTKPTMYWHAPECWLVLPPDVDAEAPRFPNRRAALRWAEEQAEVAARRDGEVAP